MAINYEAEIANLNNALDNLDREITDLAESIRQGNTILFSCADRKGTQAIKSMFDLLFAESKTDYVALTAFVIALNWKIWEHYEKGNEEYARLYNELWEQADGYACDNLKGEELDYFYATTD